MDDDAIADAFDELATRLEIAGENPFALRAYRRAARTIRELDESLEAIHTRGGLREIEGFGDAIVSKIEQALDEGFIDALQRARGEVDIDVVALGRIPGLGPKRMAKLYHELGVRTLDDLQDVLEAGRITDVKGFGAAFESTLWDAIPRVRTAMGRRRIDEAHAIVERIASELAGTVPAGATRRYEPFVERIDAASPHDEATIRAALEALGMASLAVKRDTVIGELDGVEVRVTSCDPERDGRRMIELTGAADHVKNLKGWGAGHGIKWTQLDGDETAIYHELGIQWVPPECRVGREEVELGTVGGLVTIIDDHHIHGDLQMHTTFSDGAASVEDMARAAAALGYAFIGITDHAGALPVANAMDPGRIEALVQAVGAANDADLGVHVFAGCEAEIDRNGNLTTPDEALEQLDYVAAGIHAGLGQDAETQTMRYVRAVEHPLVRLLVHPTGRKVNERPGAEIDLPTVIEAAVEHDVAMEINAAPARLDLDADAARSVLGRGGLLTINTDAHHPDELGRMHWGVKTARKAFCTPQKVINTWGVDEVRAFFERS